MLRIGAVVLTMYFRDLDGFVKAAKMGFLSDTYYYGNSSDFRICH